MPESQFRLFSTKRFLPLFLTQFLGAFNDNLFKSALVMLVTFGLAERMGYNSQILITSIAGIFILPFFLFSSIAGELADKYEKSSLIRIIKIVEVVLMCLTGLGFYSLNLWLLIFLLFLMGAQSTFFGPLKYSIIPQHLDEDELIAANGLVEAGTYIAILMGTVAGGLLVLRPNGTLWISAMIVTVALAGYVASRSIPNAEPTEPQLHIDYNIFRSTYNIVREVIPYTDVFLSILGSSWFWLVGATFLSQFPTYTRDILGANEQVATFFLTTFSVGIGLGALLCNVLLKGEVNGKYVPYGATILSLGSFSLWLASKRLVSPTSGELIGVVEFLMNPTGFFITLSMLAIAIGGGVYVVPLNAIMQSRCDPERRARVIACSNVISSFAMVLSAIGVTVLLALNVTIPQIFLLMAVLNAISIKLVSHLVVRQQRARLEKEERGNS